MATLKEIIFNVKNLKAGGLQTDEVKLSDAQYAFIIDYYRALIIRQDVGAGKTINPRTVQALGKDNKVEVMRAPRSEAGEVPGCDIYKTRKEIPPVIEVSKKNLWTYVGPVYGGVPFQRSTLTKIVWDRFSKYTASITKWYESGTRIYVVTENPLTHIATQGLFENPREVLKFNETYNPMDPYNFEYPMSNTYLERMYAMMQKGEIRWASIVPQDNINDGNEQIQQQ